MAELNQRENDVQMLLASQVGAWPAASPCSACSQRLGLGTHDQGDRGCALPPCHARPPYPPHPRAPRDGSQPRTVPLTCRPARPQAHLGTKNCTAAMERYVYRRRNDGIFVFNLAKTWEKLQLAARIIVAIENPQDIVAISARPYGQRAVLKFANYTGAKATVGRHTPGARARSPLLLLFAAVAAAFIVSRLRLATQHGMSCGRSSRTSSRRPRGGTADADAELRRGSPATGRRIHRSKHHAAILGPSEQRARPLSRARFLSSAAALPVHLQVVP